MMVGLAVGITGDAMAVSDLGRVGSFDEPLQLCTTRIDLGFKRKRYWENRKRLGYFAGQTVCSHNKVLQIQ
ncbi:hypothetical protein ACFX1X_013405 [Malus domestica]